MNALYAYSTSAMSFERKAVVACQESVEVSFSEGSGEEMRRSGL
jgi:hypothetical protein